MKSSVFSIAFAAGLATAQLGDVPPCAVDCVVQYTTGNEIADCNALDIACICSNDQFLDGIACCLEDACDEQGKDDAVAYARQICSTQDVTVPDEVVCKNPSGSGSSTISSAVETETAETSSDEDTTGSATTATEGVETTGTAATTEEEETGTATETAADNDTTETDEPDAAHKALSPLGGTLGAVAALLFAL